MEYLEFETLNFIQRGRRKIGLIPKNVFTITSNGKNSVRAMFSRELTYEIERFKFLVVKRNPMTMQDYLVFNNDSGMSIIFSKTDKRASISCKDFCLYLQNKYGKGETHFRMKISDDKSNSSSYATYEIVGKTQE